MPNPFCRHAERDKVLHLLWDGMVQRGVETERAEERKAHKIVWLKTESEKTVCFMGALKVVRGCRLGTQRFQRAVLA